jgi:hypothetical protein
MTGSRASLSTRWRTCGERSGDAIDELRRRHGRAFQRRFELAGTDVLERLACQPDEFEEDLERSEERVDDRRAAARVLQLVSSNDAELLTLRFIDEAPSEAIAARVGVSRSQYHRRLALADATSPQGARESGRGRRVRGRPCASLLPRAAVLDRYALARREIHLEGCVHCRAFQRLRQQQLTT